MSTETVTLYGTPTEHHERKQKIERAGRNVEVKPVAYSVTIIGENSGRVIDKRTFTNFDYARLLALTMNADLMPVI